VRAPLQRSMSALQRQCLLLILLLLVVVVVW
jgi:hypothetical protein